jgi:hypothetical protein
MKPRNREINIFNMSLLDILCGALGAFCFMMLTLFPYYTKAKQQQGGASAGEVGSLQQQLEQAKKRIEELDHQFAVAVQIWWGTPLAVHVYLWRPANPPQPEPTLEKKNDTWISKDRKTTCYGGPCSETWLIHDLSRGNQVKVYYVLADTKNDPAPALVTGRILSAPSDLEIPKVMLDAQHRIVLVGTMLRTNDDKLTFTPAAPGSQTAAPQFPVQPQRQIPPRIRGTPERRR